MSSFECSHVINDPTEDQPYKTEIIVEALTHYKGFRGYYEMELDELSDNNICYVEYKIHRLLFDNVSYGNRPEIRARVRHPLGPDLIMLSMGASEAARDDRIRKGQEDSGYEFKEFIPGCRVERGCAKLQIYVLQRYYRIPDKAGFISLDLDGWAVRCLEDEQISRASSMSFEENLVRNLFTSVIETFEKSFEVING